MAKKVNKPGQSLLDVYGPLEFDGEEVEQNLTYNQWKPEIGDSRTFVLMGFEERESKEFKGTFLVYYGKDLKTGEDFSFAPGGLFDYIIKDKNIVNGDRLGVRFRGTVEIPSGRANQWDIVKLKAPGKVKG